MFAHIRSLGLILVLCCLLFASCQKAHVQSTPPEEASLSDPSAQEQTSQIGSLPSSEQDLQKAELRLNLSELTLSQGKSALLEAVLLPQENSTPKLTFASKNTAIAYIDQAGRITALKEGKTTLTVSTDSGLFAECAMTVTPREADSMDGLNMQNSEQLWGTFSYGEGIRLNGGELVFSPYVYLDKINAQTIDRYDAYLRFTYLQEDSFFDEGYVFPSVKVTPEYNKGGWLDLVLQGKNTDCGFCPRAEGSYKIDLVLTAQNGKAICHGTYYVYGVSTAIEKCKYYRPTPQPGILQREEGQVLLTYAASEGGMLEGTDSQLLFADEQGTPVKAVAEQGYRFLMWSDGKTDAERIDKGAKTDVTLTALFVKEAADGSSTANMYIFTTSGESILSKDYQSATMVITGASHPADNLTASLQIKGRGNSSWNGSADQSSYDSKNSYRIKLDEKEQLLGIGDSKNKDWVLNANKFDLSGLRNYLVWELADRMETLPYVPDCTWVQLYVNGAYRGLYTLSEHIEAANDRVEIDDTAASADKGYLLEIDFRGNGENDPYFYVEGYAPSADNKREFVIKSECTKADVAFISDYVQKCHNALMSGDKSRIESLVDLPSLIDMYIIEELSKDVDVGAASFYMQKSPEGKLCFTAPWDFDFGFGTYGSGISANGLVSVNDKGCPWYAELIKHTWFKEAVLQRMNELDGSLKETLSALVKQAEILKPAADQNAEFWKMYGTNYHNYVSSQVSSELHNYDEHIDFLTSWTQTRWTNLKELMKK